MALLLAVYQKMKLTREKNALSLELIQKSSKLDRLTKNIERTQKYYTSLFSKLDQDAKNMQNNASMFFRNMSGLGSNVFGGMTNPYMYGYSSGTNMNTYNPFIQNMVQQLLKDGVPYGAMGADGKPSTYPVSQTAYKAIQDNLKANNGKLTPKMVDGKPVTENRHLFNWTDETKNPKRDYYKYNGFTEEDVQAVQLAEQYAQAQFYDRQQWLGNATQQYANNVSIWTEARKEELEAEQAAALDPLSYQETMLDLEKTQIETRLEKIKAELESYNNLAKEEIQNSAPKFGLG